MVTSSRCECCWTAAPTRRPRKTSVSRYLTLGLQFAAQSRALLANPHPSVSACRAILLAMAIMFALVALPLQPRLWRERFPPSLRGGRDAVLQDGKSALDLCRSDKCKSALLGAERLQRWHRRRLLVTWLH